MFVDESVELDKKAFRGDKRVSVTYLKAAESLLKAYAEEGFDASRYFSSHRDVLSLDTDAALVVKVLVASYRVPNEELCKFMKWVWGLRELVAIYRVNNGK